MTPVRKTQEPFRLSIRRLAFIVTFAFAAIAVVVSVALIWITTSLEDTIATVVRDTQSQAIANELELSLLMYQRLSNIHVLTGETEADSARKLLAFQMRESLAQAEDYAGSAEERDLLDQVALHLKGYLEAREQAEASVPGLDGVVRATASPLDIAIGSLESLGDLNGSQVKQAHAAAERLDGVAGLIGVIAGASLVLGLLAVVLGVQGYVLRPILALHGAMARFRTGDVSARSKDGGLREIAQLTQGFNEMADTLARQRQDQLAFLAGVAHDLRNPLNALKLGLYALEHEQSTGSRGLVRARLDRQVERLTRMVEDLLDATRIEAGALELRQEEFDIRGVVDDMVRLYTPTSPDHQIVVEQASEAVIVHGDPLRIEQVVSNLLSNAIKFSPGGGLIRVRVRAEHGQALIAVCDQGLGISQDEMPNLFLPFRRRKQDAVPGTGLGLSVVRRIVTAHGGTIAVESTPAVGTTFRVRFPLATGKGAEDNPRLTAKSGNGDSVAHHT